MKRILNNMNSYFFDTEDRPELDLPACLLFYGVCGLSTVTAAAYFVLFFTF